MQGFGGYISLPKAAAPPKKKTELKRSPFQIIPHDCLSSLLIFNKIQAEQAAKFTEHAEHSVSHNTQGSVEYELHVLIL